MKKLLLILSLVAAQAGFTQEVNEAKYEKDTSMDKSHELQIIAQENPCVNGGQRFETTIPLIARQTPLNSFYVGVSASGDIAYVSNTDGLTKLHLNLCPRAGADGSGYIIKKFELNTSSNCEFDEITAGDIFLGTRMDYNYPIKFFPVNIPGTKQLSSLCGGEAAEFNLNDDRKINEKNNDKDDTSKKNVVKR